MDLACAMMWGFKDYDGLNKLQNRVIRLYLGTGKFTPIPTLLVKWDGSHPMFELIVK